MKLSDALALADGAATVVIRNTIVSAEWSDTLCWEAPEGWTITPSVYPFTMEAGGTVTAQFTVQAAGKLYPLPEISTRLPYGEGRSTKVTRELEVARTVLCPKATGQVVIDGQLTEACWLRPVSALFNNEGTPSTIDTTRFFFAYDEGNLYIGAYCGESEMASLREAMTERDAAVYTEDAVGVMFQPGGPNADIPQVYVNPLGTVCDQLIERASDGHWSGRDEWNGDVEVKTVRGADYYAVEMRIPLAQFGAIADSGDRWRMQFRRKQVRTNSAAAFQSPWQYDPTGFGELVFE
jgi:hypothetical protein